jgi:hypothetical protein
MKLKPLHLYTYLRRLYLVVTGVKINTDTFLEDGYGFN